MPIPSTLDIIPEQEPTELDLVKNHNTLTMPTPEAPTQQQDLGGLGGSEIWQLLKNISVSDIPVNCLNEQTVNLLRTCAATVEAQIKQQSAVNSAPPQLATTTVSQATDDCDVYPTKPAAPSITDVFPTVKEVNTSVEVHSPDEAYSDKPWFGHISEGQSNVLAKILHSNGIHDDGAPNKSDLTSQWTVKQQQVELGLNDVSQPDSKIQQQEFADPKQLPDLSVFSDSFELDDKAADQVLASDPYLVGPLNVKLEQQDPTENVSCKENVTTIDLGEFHATFATDTNLVADITKDVESDLGPYGDPPPPSVGSVDMGPYRDQPPPSVCSVVSDTTCASEYSNVLSPRMDDFEAFESMPQKVSGRRNTKRRTSGGKNLTRLVSSTRSGKGSVTKPYPDASARNGRLSRFQHMEYQESNIHEGWWNMLKNVEKLFLGNIDFQSSKVEDLRKYCHDLFAVVLFAPGDWGNNQKRKGIYREILKEQYDWDPTVPFRSINNAPKKGDAPRANKEDLVKIGIYLMRRYRDDVRSKVSLRNELNQLVRLQGVEEQGVAPAAVATAPAPPVANTVRNHLALAAETPSLQPLITPKVEPTTPPCDFNLPVNQATATNPLIAMETQPAASTTLDLDLLLQCLGPNCLVGQDNLSMETLGIQPRQPEMMQVDDDLTYKNPEMKALKREHSYSMPDEMENAGVPNPVMTIFHDTEIPGAVLQLAETKPNSMVKAVQEDYSVAKFQESCPNEFSRVMDMIDALN